MTAPDRVPPAKRLFIGIPVYGDVPGETMHSLAESVGLLKDAGCEVTWTLMMGCCYVDHARNQIVEEFLQSSATDLLMVDSDMEWPFASMAQIVGATRSVVAGLYRKKRDDFDWPVRFKVGTHQMEPDGVIEASHVPTGFLRVNRSVFTALRPRTMEYGNGHDGGKKWRNWFRTLYEDNVFWGEDFQFCRDLTAAGIKMWVLPDMTLGHVGKKVYTGNWAEWMQSQGAAKRRTA